MSRIGRFLKRLWLGIRLAWNRTGRYWLWRLRRWLKRRLKRWLKRRRD